MKRFNKDLITEQVETNYSLIGDDSFIWDYDKFPFATGDIFPPEQIKEVANISLTNRYLYEGRMEEVLNGAISLFPDNKLLSGLQLREIIQSLPLFSNIVNDFLGLMVSNGITIDIDADDDFIDGFIEESNLNQIIIEEIKSLFLDCNSAYIVNFQDSKPYISKINSKNIIPFSNPNIKGLLECLVVFSIHKHIKYGDIVEFTCYMRTGEIIQKTFLYSKGKIGKHIEELDASGISYDGFNFSNIVYFNHNSSDSDSLIGQDIISTWTPSISALCRSLQTLYRAGDEHRERLTFIPEDAVQKDNIFIGLLKNIITFGKQGLKHEPKYITPDLQVESLEKLVIQARKEIANDSRLGEVFFNIESVGGGLTSGKALKTMLTPTLLRSKLYQQQLIAGIKELVIKIAAAGGFDLSNSKITIKFNETVNDDYKELTDAIISQYQAGLLSLEDAILRLNSGMTSKQAKNKALELKGMDTDKKPDDIDVIDTMKNTLNPTIQEEKEDVISDGYNPDLDPDTKWEGEVIAVNTIS